jgi:hypothetical protein
MNCTGTPVYELLEALQEKLLSEINTEWPISTHIFHLTCGMAGLSMPMLCYTAPTGTVLCLTLPLL